MSHVVKREEHWFHDRDRGSDCVEWFVVYNEGAGRMGAFRYEGAARAEALRLDARPLTENQPT